MAVRSRPPNLEYADNKSVADYRKGCVATLHHRRIESLAMKMLDKRELKLAAHFAERMAESRQAIHPLVLDILPVYYEGDQTLEPDTIYRSLMYIHQYAVNGDSRSMLHMMGNHLESCLQVLGRRGYNKPLGDLIKILQGEKILSDALASQLIDYNKTAYVPAKHLDSNKVVLESLIDKRTFSYLDAAYAFLMMRKLSMDLFKLLKENGTALPQDWKPFRDSWFTVHC